MSPSLLQAELMASFGCPVFNVIENITMSETIGVSGTKKGVSKTPKLSRRVVVTRLSSFPPDEKMYKSKHC